MPEQTNSVDTLGALVPDRNIHDIPATPAPPVYDTPGVNPFGTGDPDKNSSALFDKLSNDFNALRKQASTAFDPSNIVEPIRWEDPSYEGLQRTFDNPDREGLFKTLGFYPGRDNEDFFANSLTKWQKLGLAWDQMGALAKETFVEQWKTEAEFWGNLATGDVKDAFLPFDDKEELQRMSDSMKMATLNNYIPLTAEERNGKYGFGKFATGLGQFGFTLGTIGAFGTQLGLEFVASALLAPETSGASVGAFAASLANKTKRLFTIGKFFSNLEKLENGAKTITSIRKAYDYLKDTKNLKTGFGKFYTFTKEWNAAAGEAKFEAASSYTDYIERKIQKAKEEGRTLSVDEMSALEDEALNVAMSNGVTNTGLLFAMNKLNMSNLFRGPFNVQKRFLSEFSGNIGKDLVEVGGKMISRFEIPTFSKAGMLRTAKGFGGWALDSAWEGVQEVAQGASANYWDEYYSENYGKRDLYDKLSLVGKTISNKLDSSDSFDEFVSGFIIGVPGAAVNRAIGGLTSLQYKDQMKQYKQQVKDYAKLINEYENDPFRIFDPRISNLNTQAAISQQMDKAVAEKNIYAYKNLSKQQMRDMVMLGIKTGKLDYMIGNMKDALQNLSDEDFQKQFGLVSDSTTRKKAADYINEFENTAEQLVKDYDKAKQEFSNPYGDTAGLKKGSKEEIDQKLKYVAWEDAVQDYVFEKNNYQDTIKRMSSILGDVKDHIGDGLYNAFYTMTSDKNIDREIEMLTQEIKSNSQIENPDKSVTDLLKKKKTQLEALQRWRKSYLNREASWSGEAEELGMRKIFRDVLNTYQSEEAGAVPLTDDGVKAAYDSIVDFFRLQTDNEKAVKNISFLSSPEGFAENFESRAFAAENHYKNVVAQRELLILSKNAVLKAIEEDKEFSSNPDVQRLVEAMDQAIAAKEYDDAAMILDNLVVLHEGRQSQEETSENEQGAVEKTSSKEDSSDVERKPVVGETLTSDSNQNYKIRGFTDNGSVQWENTKDGSKGVWSKEKFDEYIKDGRLKYDTTTTSDIKAKKADIEKNRKADLEQLKTIPPGNYINIIGNEKDLLKKFREYLTDVLGWERMPIGFSKGNLTLDYLGTELKIPASVNILVGNNAILNINVEDVIEAKYNAELAALEGKQKQPVPAEESVKNLLESIKIANLSQITAIEKDLQNNADLFTDDDLELLLNALDKRKADLKKAVVPKTKFKKTDQGFIKPYNEVVLKLNAALKNPNTTEQDIIAIIGEILPVLDTLEDPVVREEYKKKFIEKQKQIIERLKQNKEAKDITLVKDRINKKVATNKSFIAAIEDVKLYIQSSVDESLKEEAVRYFEETFKEQFEKKMSALEKAAAEGLESNVIKGLIEKALKFKETVLKYVKNLEELTETLKKQNEESGMDLAVDVDEDFSNPVDKRIQSRDFDFVSTQPQKDAVRNLKKAGILSYDEFEEWDDSSGQDSSRLINLGVARIYTLNINKEIFKYTKDKKDRTALEKILSSYLKDDGYSTEEAQELVEKILNSAETSADFEKVVLTTFNIPSTKDKISDEQLKTLYKYKNAIYDLILNGNIIDLISELDNIETKLINNPQIEFDPSLFFNDVTEKTFSKLLDDYKTFDSFKKEVLELASKMSSFTSLADINKEAATIANKYGIAKSKTKTAFLAESIKALLLKSYQTGLEVNTGFTNNKQLTEDEMLGVLSGNNVALSIQDINQIKDYAINVVLEEAKKKFDAVNAYKQQPLSQDEDPLSGPSQQEIRAKFSTLRLKNAEDRRTFKDLQKQFKVEGDIINTKEALQQIVNSPFSTDSEKEIARKLARIIPASDFIKVDNSADVFGEYDQDTDQVTINLQAVSYDENFPTYQVETLILHELLHKIIEKEAADTSSNFYKRISSLIEIVKKEKGAATFYAFQENLEKDEQVREFVIEALTNPAFQYLLSKVDYPGSGLNLWEKFIEYINQFFAKMGFKTTDTALGEVLSITQDLLEDVTTEAYISKISTADEVELKEILADLTKNPKSVSPVLLDSLITSVRRKLNDYKRFTLTEESKKMKKITTSDKKTYYYTFENGKFKVLRRTRTGFAVVKMASVKSEIFRKTLDKTSIKKLFSADLINDIKRIAGDPAEIGTYASRQMDDITVGDSLFPNAKDVKIGFRFSSVDDYNDFVRKFWMVKNKKYKQEDLIKTYGATNFKNYGELAYQFSRAEINTLVKKKRIDLSDKKAPFLEEVINNDESRVTQDEIFDMFKYILKGGNLDLSEQLDIKRFIKDRLQEDLDFEISPELQEEIENLIFESSNVEQKEEPGDLDVIIEEEKTEGIEVFNAIPKDALEFENAYNIDAEQPFDKQRTAVETHVFRSFNLDVVTDKTTGDYIETESFQNFYYKIRNIINKLSVKNQTSLAGLKVTLTKDRSELRWDGSTEAEGWKNSQKGVIGYISDEKGNPIIFNKEGQIVGKLNKEDLANTLGLNDGENQIVYFNLFANPEQFAANKAKEKNPEDFETLMSVRNEVMSGKEFIAPITKVSMGQLNKKALSNPTNKNRQDTRNDDFRAQLNQPNVSFDISVTGFLNAIITSPEGAVNRFSLFPPNTGYVKIKLNGKEYDIVDYLALVMKAYHEMQKRKDKNLPKMQVYLTNFAYNMWLTGMNRNIQIPKSYSKIGIRENGSLNYYTIVSEINGEIVINYDALKHVKGLMSNKPVNVYKHWLSGKIPFYFPIVNETSEGLTITLSQKDYKQFLFEEVGMKSNVVEIPSAEYLKAYNSIVHFAKPQPFTEKPAITAPSEKEVLDDPSAVKKSVDNIKPDDETKIEDKEIQKLKKGKRFKVPSYSELFEKICK